MTRRVHRAVWAARRGSRTSAAAQQDAALRAEWDASTAALLRHFGDDGR